MQEHVHQCYADIRKKKSLQKSPQNNNANLKHSSFSLPNNVCGILVITVSKMLLDKENMQKTQQQMNIMDCQDLHKVEIINSKIIFHQLHAECHQKPRADFSNDFLSWHLPLLQEVHTSLQVFLDVKLLPRCENHFSPRWKTDCSSTPCVCFFPQHSTNRASGVEHV